MKILTLAALLSLSSYSALVPEGLYKGKDRNNKECSVKVIDSKTSEDANVFYKDDLFTNLKNKLKVKINLPEREYEYNFSSTFYLSKYSYHRYELESVYPLSEDRHEYLKIILNDHYVPMILQFHREKGPIGFGELRNQCVIIP